MSELFYDEGKVKARVYVDGGAGKTALKVTASGAGDETVKDSPGTVYGLVTVSTGVTVKLKDDGAEIWAVSDTASPSIAAPIACSTSIVLTFSGAGDAFIIFD